MSVIASDTIYLNSVKDIADVADRADTNASTALQDADDAKKVATNYLAYSQQDGLTVGYKINDQFAPAKTVISGSGVEIFDENGDSSAEFTSTRLRFGDEESSHTTVSSDGMRIFAPGAIRTTETVEQDGTVYSFTLEHDIVSLIQVKCFFVTAGERTGSMIFDINDFSYVDDTITYTGSNSMWPSFNEIDVLYVYEGIDVIGAFTTNGAQIGSVSESHIEIDGDSEKFFDNNGDEVGSINSDIVGGIEQTKQIFSVEVTMESSPKTGSYTLPSTPIGGSNILLYIEGVLYMNPNIRGWNKTYWLTVGDAQNIITASDDFGGYCDFNIYYDGSTGFETTAHFMTGIQTISSGGFTIKATYLIEGSTSTYEFGYDVSASGAYSFASGKQTESRAPYAFASGFGCIATGTYSHAEGYTSSTTGPASHAEGYKTNANGPSSHAEGESTLASGTNAHAEGYMTSAYGNASHAGGYGTITSSPCQTAIGKFNEADSNNTYAFIIGNGQPDSYNGTSRRSNAFTVAWDGETNLYGVLKPRSGIAFPNSGAASSLSSPDYFITMDAFADGGALHYTRAQDVAAAIGAVPSQASVNASATNVPTATDTTLCHTASLAAGHFYILLGTATFPQSTTGRRAIFFASSDTGANIDRYSRVVHASSNGGLQMQLIYICNPTQATTYYLRAYQNSGATQSVTNGGIRVLKIF